MVDHNKQCRHCIYAYWTVGKRGYGSRFIWCNHLDMTGEPHIVKDGICQSVQLDHVTKNIQEIVSERMKAK